MRIIGGRIIPRARSAAAAPTQLLAFPIANQEARVASIATAMTRCRSPDAADLCIAKALRAYTAELRARGMPGRVVSREVHALEAQVRAAVWRHIFPWVATEKAVSAAAPSSKPCRAQRAFRQAVAAGQRDLFGDQPHEPNKARHRRQRGRACADALNLSSNPGNEK
jgi:hypothetical protein